MRNVSEIKPSFSLTTSFPCRSASCNLISLSAPERLFVHRLAILPLIALLVCSCNTPDAALGWLEVSETNPGGGRNEVQCVTRVT